ERPSTRAAAAWSLGASGARGRDAARPLLDALVAARAAKLDRGAPQLHGRAMLLERLELGVPEQIDVRFFVQDVGACSLFALRRLGPNAAAAVPRLLALFEDEHADPFERWAAAEALGAIGGDTERVITALWGVLKDKNTPVVVQVGAVRALAE